MKKTLSWIACALFVGAVALGCGSSQKADTAKPEPAAAAPADPAQAAPPAANPCQPK
jgi:hypothetical protein